MNAFVQSTKLGCLLAGCLGLACLAFMVVVTLGPAVLRFGGVIKHPIKNEHCLSESYGLTC